MYDELFEQLNDVKSEQVEKEEFFLQRTNNHIQLVQDAAAEIVFAYPEFDLLLKQVEVHDASKLEEPERTPYIGITWRHKQEREVDGYDPYNGKGYQSPGELEKEDENVATMHHITTNSHHPEYHLEDKAEANIDKDDRNKSDKVVDASLMPEIDIAEMVADWQAMAEELQTNTARQWFEKQKDVRWHFSESQEELISKLLAVFEEEESKATFSSEEEVTEESRMSEGMEKGLRAVFKVYKDVERELEPREDDLDEAISVFLNYIKEMNASYRRDPEAMGYWASSKEHAAKVKEKYFAREKELEDALKSSTSAGRKLIALDNVVDLVHHDYYALEQFMWSQEVKVNPKLKTLVFGIVRLLRKMGKFPEGFEGVDEPIFTVRRFDPKSSDMVDVKELPTEEEAAAFVKGKKGYHFVKMYHKGKDESKLQDREVLIDKLLKVFE